MKRRHPLSLEAYLSMLPHIPTLEGDIYRTIVQLGPKTSEELEGILGRKHQSVSAALRKMKDGSVAYETGETRLTRSNRRAAAHDVKRLPGIPL